MTIQAVCDSAANGRGLWAGVFLKEYPNDTLGQTKHPLREVVAKKAHVTLAHFGRDNSRERTMVIYSALCKAQLSVIGPVADFYLELTGVGLFWRRDKPTHVTLVNSAQLCDLRCVFLGELREAGVRYDDRYGFVPHVTLNTNGNTFDMLSTRGSSTGKYGDKFVENAGAIKVAAHTRPKLVCGEAEVFA